jgi:RNA polymerase sigma factor (sigma-70 family)
LSGHIEQVNLNDKNVPADFPLVERVLNGDPIAFKIVIKNTERLVAQIIFKMIPNHEDRKDLAQDVYLKAFKSLRNFKFQSKLSTWIGQIAYNTCYNYIEKKKPLLLENTHTDYDADVDPLELLSNRTIDISENEPDNRLFKKELAEILKTEIDKLSPVYKTLITLYHNEELSYTEIMQITSLPEGTIKNYLFRARKILRNNLLLNYNREAL